MLNTAYAHIALISDGVSKWTIVDQGYLTATKSLAESAHGALVGVNILEATATSLSGTSVNVSTQIPANCILLAVGVRVTTTITIGGAGVTGTGFEIGMSGSARRNLAPACPFRPDRPMTASSAGSASMR